MYSVIKVFLFIFKIFILRALYYIIIWKFNFQTKSKMYLKIESNFLMIAMIFYLEYCSKKQLSSKYVKIIN